MAKRPYLVRTGGLEIGFAVTNPTDTVELSNLAYQAIESFPAQPVEKTAPLEDGYLEYEIMQRIPFRLPVAKDSKLSESMKAEMLAKQVKLGVAPTQRLYWNGGVRELYDMQVDEYRTMGLRCQEQDTE